MRTAFFAVLMVFQLPGMAAMSSALQGDEVAMTPQAWNKVAPHIIPALECQKEIDLNAPALKEIFFQRETSQWAFTPPRGARVLGMPVQEIVIYIDPDGEMGHSYTATVAVPPTIAANLVASRGERELVGSLGVAPGRRPTLSDVTCTVAGTRQD